MASVFLMILCVAATCGIGWCTLYVISGQEGYRGLSLPEKSGLSYMLGMGAVTVWMFITGILGLNFSRPVILLPWILLATGVLLSVIRNRPARKETGFSGPAGRWDVFFMAAIGIQAMYNFFRALIRPIEAYDSVAIYGLKAKMIYLFGTLAPDFFREMVLFFPDSHPDYPLLIPLSETWVYVFLGKLNDVLVKAVFPLYYVAFILIFYAVLKRVTGERTLALFFTFLLATIKQFSDYSTIGYADMALGVYFGVAVLYLYRYFESKKGAFLNISLASLIFCVWAKNEGTALGLIGVAALVFYAFSHLRELSKKELWRIAFYALAIIAAACCWAAFRSARGPVNENFNLSMINVSKISRGIGRMPDILYEYQKQFSGFKKWNITWILFALVFFTGFKRAFSGNTKYVTAIFLLFGALYTLIYVFSAVEIQFFLEKSASRFPLHVLPVCVFWMAVMSWKKLYLSTGTE